MSWHKHYTVQALDHLSLLLFLSPFKKKKKICQHKINSERDNYVYVTCFGVSLFCADNKAVCHNTQTLAMVRWLKNVPVDEHTINTVSVFPLRFTRH